MKKKVFSSIFLLSMFTFILAVICTTAVLYRNYSDELKSEVQSEADYIGDAIQQFDENYIQQYLVRTGQKSKNRITYIKNDGTVLYDSFADINDMDNHSQRPEFKDAVSNGSGEITRPSETLSDKTYYYALKLDNGCIIRVACETKNFFGLISKALWLIILTGIFIIILSLAISVLLTKSIVKPINNLDLNEPLENNTYDELSPLLVRMQHQNTLIKEQIKKISESKNEFDYITSNMNEGLVILSKNGNIVSANKSARKILSDYTNGSYLQLCRNNDYIEAVEKSLSGKKAKCKISKNGRIYDISVNPVSENGEFASVIFIVDITEKELSDKMRSEFSANVSHELKTPLTSIMGYAEIISNGIAQKDDIPRFAEMIHSESARLLTLIQDIIKLSRLDEKTELKERFETINLPEICSVVMNELKSKAEKSDVNISLTGENAEISGFKPVIHEMIYNLCDNAVTYNKKGGYVKISIKNDNNKIILEVSDNGIGIPSEHQSRVFERFYRVDKSHSKATGGTGLGLSIVRHGAILHNAELKLESSENQGTSIKIIFPAKKENS